MARRRESTDRGLSLGGRPLIRGFNYHHHGPARGAVSGHVRHQIGPWAGPLFFFCLIAVRLPVVGRVSAQRRAFRGCRWLRAQVVVAPPDRYTSPSAFVRWDTNVWPDEGVPKTHRHWPVGSEGVCGWLADGYHYPKTFGGQPRSIPVVNLLVCFTARRGI